MNQIIRHSPTCIVKAGKEVEAVVHDFKVNEHLVVILNQSVKLHLKWNGKLYEGKMAGLDITSQGPSFKTTQSSIRG